MWWWWSHKNMLHNIKLAGTLAEIARPARSRAPFQQKHLLARHSKCGFLGFGSIPGWFTTIPEENSLSAHALHYHSFPVNANLDPKTVDEERSSLRRRLSCFGTLPIFFRDGDVNLNSSCIPFFFRFAQLPPLPREQAMELENLFSFIKRHTFVEFIARRSCGVEPRSTFQSAGYE